MKQSTERRKVAHAWSESQRLAHARRVAKLLEADPEYFKKLAEKRKTRNYNFENREAARAAGAKGLNKRYHKEDTDGSRISTNDLPPDGGTVSE